MRNGVALLAFLLVIMFLLVIFTGRGLVQTVYNCGEARAATQRERELEQRNSENYDKAIDLLRKGDYPKARKLLEDLWDYRDGKVLLTYACARVSFQRMDYIAYSTYGNLEEIPVDYSGDLAAEIAVFREEAEKRRTELQALYDAEQEKWAEMERQLTEQREQWRDKMRAEAAAHKKPYIGMDREFISDTQLGKYDAYEIRNGVWFYYWHLYGKVFYASVKDGKVAMTGTHRVDGVTKKDGGSSKGSDPYNVCDYAHADDFYYDHYDDFVDFEDAENYYDAHS